MKNAGLELVIYSKKYFEKELFTFEPRNIAAGNVFAGNALFFDKINEKILKPIWQTTLFFDGKKCYLKEVALEGHLWYTSKDGTNRPRLGGRFRKEQPRYCTLFILTHDEETEFFVKRNSNFVLLE